MREPPGARGLGIGTGLGLDALAIAGRFRGVSLVGIDYDPNRVARAERRRARRPELRGPRPGARAICRGLGNEHVGYNRKETR